MITFSPTIFRSSSSLVFNAVQADGIVEIKSKSRPDMILMLSDSFDSMSKKSIEQDEKIRQLADLIKSIRGCK